MSANNFLPFCPTDTGTNLLSQSDYAAASDRTNGNQPGVASSKLVNKAVRQSAYVTSQIAQFVSDRLSQDVLDDATPAKLLAQIMATFQPLSRVLTKYTSGSGNWNATYYFFIASGNATAAATYTNNGITYTVVNTVAAGTLLQVTGSGAPASSGILTKASGAGDATLTFYAARAAVGIRVRAVGGGGGGGGSGTTGTAGNGGDGGNTTFGGTLVVANGGGAGGSNSNSVLPGAGGTASLGAGAVGIAIPGATGGAAATGIGATSTRSGGGNGASTAIGGGAGGGCGQAPSTAAPANSGAGGGGGGLGGTLSFSGNGGSAGGYVDAYIASPASTYAYVVGAAGTLGAAGTSGFAGTAGAAGLIVVEEFFQ